MPSSCAAASSLPIERNRRSWPEFFSIQGDGLVVPLPGLLPVAFAPVGHGQGDTSLSRSRRVGAPGFFQGVDGFIPVVSAVVSLTHDVPNIPRLRMKLEGLGGPSAMARLTSRAFGSAEVDKEPAELAGDSEPRAPDLEPTSDSPARAIPPALVPAGRDPRGLDIATFVRQQLPERYMRHRMPGSANSRYVGGLGMPISSLPSRPRRDARFRLRGPDEARTGSRPAFWPRSTDRRSWRWE